MRATIAGWLLLVLLLMAASHILRPWLADYTAADTAFAREYAGEMLLVLEQMAQEADRLAGTQAAEAYYRDTADELGRRRQAAVHLKGDLAYDFVYAFACAEEWCRASADALRRPQNAVAARQRARDALAKARAELTAISVKDYGGK